MVNVAANEKDCNNGQQQQNYRDFEMENRLVRIEEIVKSIRLVNKEGGGHLGLRSLSICDRSVSAGTKNKEKCL